MGSRELEWEGGRLEFQGTEELCDCQRSPRVSVSPSSCESLVQVFFQSSDAEPSFDPIQNGRGALKIVEITKF